MSNAEKDPEKAKFDRAKSVVGHYAILIDDKDPSSTDANFRTDTTVYRVSHPNHNTTDGRPDVVELFTAEIGWPGGMNLHWRGHDLGSKTFTGFGKTKEDAVLDALSAVNRQVTANVDTLTIIKMLIAKEETCGEAGGKAVTDMKQEKL